MGRRRRIHDKRGSKRTANAAEDGVADADPDQTSESVCTRTASASEADPLLNDQTDAAQYELCAETTIETETDPLRDDQAKAVADAVAAQDLNRLRELAYAEHGFCNVSLRRSAWFVLLGLSPDEASSADWRHFLVGLDEDSRDASVMKADVQRSVYSWDVHTNIKDSVRDLKRVDLSEVMHAILRKHSGRLGYFQGFHDIVLVFLEVGSPSQAFHMVERLALFHLSDQLCCPFDRGLVPLLGVLFHMMAIFDRPLAKALCESDCKEMHFAVSWILTWFAHSLPRLHNQVMRLYDCLISSHPAAVLYFAADLLIQHRGELLATERDMPEMVAVIQSLPLKTVDVDQWAQRAKRLMIKLPPERLFSRLHISARRALPVTTPLVHYPHPWMQPALKCSHSSEDLLKLAPVYLPDGGAGAWPPEGLIERSMAALPPAIIERLAALLRKSVFLGFGGATVALVLALSVQVLRTGFPVGLVLSLTDQT